MFFEFNFYSSLLLIGFVQALVYAAFLINRGRREEKIADYLAAGILITGALYVAQWMLGFAGWYDSHDWRTTIMFYTPWTNFALLGPLVWLYFRALTNATFTWRKKYAWHFLLWGITTLPSLGIFLYDFVYHLLIQGGSFEFFHNTRGPASEWDNNVYLWPMDVLFYLIRIQFIGYLIWTFLDFRKYQRYLRAEFSNAEELSFTGILYTILLLPAGLLLVFVLNTISRVAGLGYQGAWNSFFVMSVVIYIAAIQFYRTDPVRARNLRFAPEAKADAEEKLELKPIPVSAEESEQIQYWREKLEKYLRDNQPYLNPELSLGELAKALKTNTSQLSKVVNSSYGQNFNDFINNFRCQTFLASLREGQHQQQTLLSLAMESGFNSKATFNRAFKKQYGINPGQAARRIDQGEEISAVEMRPLPEKVLISSTKT